MRKTILIIAAILVFLPVAVSAKVDGWTEDEMELLFDTLSPNETGVLSGYSWWTNANALVLNNLAGSAAPTANDDAGDGYSAGSVWVDLTNDNFYLCVDATEGAAVWSSGGGDTDTNTQLFEGATRTALTTDDTTPTVAHGGLYECASTGAMTITDFNDGTDHGSFSAGDIFGLFMDDGNVTIDFSDNANIEGNADIDFTGSASAPRLLVFQFDDDDDKWYCINLYSGMNSPTEFSIDGIEIDTIVDVTGATYTTSELMARILSNYGDTGALEMDFPARSEGWNFTYIIEAAQNVTLDPNGTEAWYLNGTQGSAGQAIVNESPTVGESISCVSTENAVYCKSSDSDWVFD